jgi:hypothetical protein
MAIVDSSLCIIPEDLRCAVSRMIKIDENNKAAMDEIQTWCAGKHGINTEDVYRLACCAFNVTTRRQCENLIKFDAQCKDIWKLTFQFLCCDNRKAIRFFPIQYDDSRISPEN